MALGTQAADDELRIVGGNGVAEADGSGVVPALYNAVPIATTSPAALNTGPPELPRLSAASIWMNELDWLSGVLRSSALTMPAVTVLASPNGLPIRNTGSPGRNLSLSPNVTAGSGRSASTFSKAISLCPAAASRVARNRVVSFKMTITSAASAIACRLVTMTPDGSMMKPEA